MHPAEQFIEYTPWSQTEKKTARGAFEKAFEMQCAAITAEAKRMMAKATAPRDIWRVHDYLSEQRRTVDRIYDYRYSVLLSVFSRLLRDGWLTEADLTGLRKDRSTLPVLILAARVHLSIAVFTQLGTGAVRT